jgi:hypothetical protein
MVEERPDQRGVEIAERQLMRRPAGLALHEAKQHAEGVPVGGDRVGAGLALTDQPLGEKGLQQRRERIHCSPPFRSMSSRCAASSSNSGTAERYQ